MKKNEKNDNNKIIELAVSGLVTLVVTMIPLIVKHFLNKETSNNPTQSEKQSNTIDEVAKEFNARYNGFDDISLFADDYDDIKTNHKIMDEPFVLFDSFIHLGEISALIADAKVGKTLLACHIARNPIFKKVVYFAFDDIGYNQINRYKQVDTIYVISRTQFNTCLEELKKIAVKKCGEDVYKKDISNFAYRLRNRFQKMTRELGVDDKRKIEELFLLNLLMKSDLCRDADLVILDSLNALFKGHLWLINRESIENIIEPRRKTGKSMILLHHLNSKGKSAGSRDLPQVVDLVLRLEKVENSNIRLIKVEDERYPQGMDSCYVEILEDKNKNVYFELCESGAKNSTMKDSSLKTRVEEIIQNRATITFDELYNMLCDTKSIVKGSLKNVLKELEDNGIVSKDCNGTWDIITNCQYISKSA